MANVAARFGAVNRLGRLTGLCKFPRRPGLAASALGCSTKRIHFEPPNCGGPAPYSHLDSRLVAGTVTYPFGDRPAESWTLVAGSGPPSQGHCTAFLANTVVPSGTARDGGSGYDDGVLTISCGDAQPWELLIHGLSARSLGMGTFAYPPAQADNPDFTPTVEPLSSRLSCLTVTPHRISLEITRASGGPAPYPRMVTSDYARDFTVRFEPSLTSRFPTATAPITSPASRSPSPSRPPTWSSNPTRSRPANDQSPYSGSPRARTMRSTTRATSSDGTRVESS